jgi:hypothetical protein
MGDVVSFKDNKPVEDDDLKDRVVLIRGPLTSQEVQLIAETVFSYRQEVFDVAEGEIVEVGVQVKEGRIVRAPVTRFFDFVRRGLFDAQNWPDNRV